MEISVGNLAEGSGGKDTGNASGADGTAGQRPNCVKKWKRGDVHPETGKLFWAMDRGKEWWRDRKGFNLAIENQRKYANNTPEFIGPRQWKAGDVNPSTGLVFVQYNRKGWAQVWVTKEGFTEARGRQRTKARETRRANPQKFRDRDNRWNANHPGVRAAQLKERRLLDPLTELKRQYEWRKRNPEKVRASARKQYRKRSRAPLFRIRNNLSRRLWELLFAVGARKSDRTLKIVGCTLPEFRAHLEKQFLPGMSWDNYGPYRKKGPRMWCVEHITPCALASTAEEIEALYHHTNLRPFWSKENLQKLDYLPCGTRASHKKRLKLELEKVVRAA